MGGLRGREMDSKRKNEAMSSVGVDRVVCREGSLPAGDRTVGYTVLCHLLCESRGKEAQHTAWDRVRMNEECGGVGETYGKCRDD